MSAPAFGDLGTYNNGATGRTSLAIDVPNNVGINDIIVVSIYKENTATITPDVGFTQCAASPTPTSSPQVLRMYTYWKRATGSESTASTYSFLWTGSTYASGVATRIPGCITTGDPWDTGAGAPVSSATSGNDVAAPSLSLTTQGPDRLLYYASTSYNSGAWTQASGFTGRGSGSDGEMITSDKVQLVAGSTGSVQASKVGVSTHSAWLGALIGITAAPAGGLYVPERFRRQRPLLVR